MATFDRTYGIARTDAGSRVHRDMRLDWSALFGGGLIGGHGCSSFPWSR